MSLPYHPTIRPAIGGYVVAATNAAGTELLWGPHPDRPDAEAVAKRLTVRLINERAASAAPTTRHQLAQAIQLGLFEETA
jgi:hypothetical protein